MPTVVTTFPLHRDLTSRIVVPCIMHLLAEMLAKLPNGIELSAPPFRLIIWLAPAIFELVILLFLVPRCPMLNTVKNPRSVYL